MKSLRTTKKNELGPQGFKLYRVTNASSYDPAQGIEWMPPKESDELFEALRAAFPGRKTHRERMCEALMQFLASELEQDSNSKELPVVAQSDASKSLQASKRPAFSAEANHIDNSNLSPIARQEHGSEPKTGVRRSGKDWEDMTVVWKSNVGLTKGARPRRMMTEEERTDYRMRRVRGACVSCKRKKRKCNHDPEPSPSSSSDTVENLPPTPPLRAQRPKPPSVASLPSAMKGSTTSQQKTKPKHDTPPTTTPGDRPSKRPYDPNVAKLRAQTGLPTMSPSQQDAASQSYVPAANDISSACNWNLLNFDTQQTFDMSQNYDLGLVYPSQNNALPPPAFDFGPMPTDMFDFSTLDFTAGGPDVLDNFDFDSFLHVPEPMSAPHTQTLPSGPTHDYSRFKQQTGLPLKRGRHLACSPALMPSQAVMENNWERAYDQASVEQWLDQKVIEEFSAPRNPELEIQHLPAPQPQHQPQPRLQPQSQPQPDEDDAQPRRRVKFDFSTLIDGPPTLSTPPAEILEQQDSSQKEAIRMVQQIVRAPRSSSRHSTASRMSFSDIASLSSALTTLSMKDAESRRGSIYSAGSERLDLDDDDADISEGHDINAQDEERTSNASGEGSWDTASDDASDEFIDWTEWNIRDQKADQRTKMAEREDLLDKYVRIKMHCDGNGEGKEKKIEGKSVDG